jgi:iron complex transport system substrate-binding protein
MRPARFAPLLIFCSILAHSLLAGCEQSPPEPAPGKPPTVACFSPAATDLIVAMGAADHLVAVSPYDNLPELAHLPRAGDYQATDWEQIRIIRPQVMIRQFAPDRMPPGLAQKCAELNIQLVNPQIHVLEDVFVTLKLLGEHLGETEKAEALAAKLRAQLDAVSRRTAGRPAVRTLIVHDELAQQVIGPGGFLDDILRIAGGENAAAGLGKQYVSIDREMLRAIDPEVIIQFLPGATPQVQEQAKQTWTMLADLPAVKAGRVHTLTEPYLLLPGAHIGDVAEKLVNLLHPPTASTEPSNP